MPSRTFHTATEDQTIALGRSLAPELSGTVLLIGNLGVGKTTMAKGIVEGRGVSTSSEVSSPTFTLVHQYGREADPVYHVDLYRLDEQREVESLGLDDLFRSGSLVLLEWAERFPALLPRGRTEIRITANEDDSRDIVVSAYGTSRD